MYKTDKIIVSLIVVSIIATCIGLFRAPRVIVEPTPQTVGSGEDAYTFANITSANASATAGVRLSTISGVLHTIVIASSSPAFTTGGQGIRVYDGDATSTGTLITTIKSTASEQTLFLDAAFKNGLVLDVPVGFAGSYTFTSR